MHEPQQVALRRPQRNHRSAISDDYVVYMQESDYHIGINKDPVSFSHAVESKESKEWINAMKEELKSMKQNEVWDLVELPHGCKRVGCKWVFLKPNTTLVVISNGIKLDLLLRVTLRKMVLITRRHFLLFRKKDSLRIIMALVAHYDLELHQMDVKTAFLNEDLDEDVYMDQPEGFSVEGKEQLVCKLKKSIYGLKQASRQWYIKFNTIITSFGFKENTVDHCIYRKISGSKFVYLVRYVDDVLLVANNLSMLHETKEFLSTKDYMLIQ